ncbi:MAG TPA: Ger(x)C family spore germination protein [Bacillota bacterium]|nr:Ger(x)C family spore germination protein [Bacillota bacterium]
MLKLIKQALLVLLMVIVAMLAASCWNYREIEDLSIVSGVALDPAAKGSYEMTVEIVEMQGQQASKTVAKRISGTGETLFDAIRNIISLSGKKVYWSHCKVLILNQRLLLDDVVKILDWFNRDSETRADIHIFVSQQQTAKEILDARGTTNEVVAFQLDDVMRSEKSLSKAPSTMISDFIVELGGEGIAPIVPVVRLAKTDSQTTLQVWGTALFNEDRLAQFLNGEDSKPFLMVRDLLKGGVLVHETVGPKGKVKMALEIFKCKTKMKSQLEGGKPTIKLETTLDIALDDVAGELDITNEKDTKKLERELEEQMNKRISQLVKKVQETCDSDVFGFGAIVREQQPALWKKLSSNWGKEFKHLRVTANTHVHIRNTAKLYKSLPKSK